MENLSRPAASADILYQDKLCSVSLKFQHMKARFSSLLMSILLFSSLTQAQTQVWPVAGKTAGEDILCKPQGYIGEELSFGELFLGGNEEDFVLCPADGIIQNICIVYHHSLVYVVSDSLKPGTSFDQSIEAADFGKGTKRKYYTGAVSIRFADGRKIHLSGLSGNYSFQTGQRVSAGDTLGRIGYSYKAIQGPSLMVSVSDRAGKVVDPMSPFGLKTTFVEPEALTREDPLPVGKAREDLEVLKQAICEIYPSLKDRMPEQAFRSFMDSLAQTITAPVDPAADFRMLLRQVLHKIPDSHFYLYPDPIKTDLGKVWTPGEFLTFCDDTVRVLLTTPRFSQYEGKVVTHINGAPARDYAKRAEVFVSYFDGNNKSMVQEQNVLLGRYGMMLNWGSGKDSAHELVFSDGTSAVIPFDTRPAFKANDTYRQIARWYGINSPRDEDDVFETRELNDSTSYLGLKTFEMLSEQVERVRGYLDNCKSKYLIVDVRNNAGGHSEVLMQILSCFSGEPMDRQNGGFNRVNQKGPFPSLKYSMNYTPDSDIFPEYEAGADGFYLKDTLETCSVVMPDANVCYDGRVYVLTNARSLSTATLFPAVLVRNRRGVSVGRETGSGYHSMAALKFADIRLPNSLQTIRIPMVQLVFDTTACDRLPAGRGLLPDYPLHLTYNEITGGADGNTDVMLEYALSLIAAGKYLDPEDPFEAFDKTQAPSFLSGKTVPALVSFLLAAVVIFFIVNGPRRYGN